MTEVNISIHNVGSSETLRYFTLNNVIDEDLQAILRPLNFLQSLVFQFKYRIKDSFITSNNNYYKCAIFFATSISVVLYLLYMTNELMQTWAYEEGSFFISIIDTIFSIIGYMLNLIVNITQSNRNVELIVKLQAVFNITKVVSNISKSFIICNWINSAGILLYAFGGLTYFYLRYDLMYFGFIVELSFDLNIVYAIQLIKFVNAQLSIWILVMKDSSNFCNNIDASYSRRLYKAYFYILDVFDNFKKVFQVMVTFYMLYAFLHCMDYIQYLIDLNRDIKLDEYFPGVMTMLVIWGSKTVALLVIINIEFERFYIATEEAKTCMLQLFMKTNHGSEMKRFCKNVCRAHDARFGKMTACGLFTIEGKLTLRFLGAVATYTVVLLQFALL